MSFIYLVYGVHISGKTLLEYLLQNKDYLTYFETFRADYKEKTGKEWTVPEVLNFIENWDDIKYDDDKDTYLGSFILSIIDNIIDFFSKHFHDTKKPKNIIAINTSNPQNIEKSFIIGGLMDEITTENVTFRNLSSFTEKYKYDDSITESVREIIPPPYYSFKLWSVPVNTFSKRTKIEF